MEPVYLVTNVHRSGSSMLMHALAAGGLTPVYDIFSDEMNRTLTDYVPNPNGFYQYAGNVDSSFYVANKGKLIKCARTELLNLPPGNYKIAFIRRNPVEIRRSMAKWTPYSTWGNCEAATYLYEEYTNALVDYLQTRGDCEVTVLDYNALLEDSTKELSKLSTWPIDTAKAANVVDPSLYRNKY